MGAHSNQNQFIRMELIVFQGQIFPFFVVEQMPLMDNHGGHLFIQEIQNCWIILMILKLQTDQMD